MFILFQYYLYTDDKMTKTIPVKLPDEMLNEIDLLIKNGRYLSRSDFLRFSARFMLEIDSGLIDLLTKLKGSLRTKKTIKELKKDAELEAMAEIDKKLRRIKNAPN